MYVYIYISLVFVIVLSPHKFEKYVLHRERGIVKCVFCIHEIRIVES